MDTPLYDLSGWRPQVLKQIGAQKLFYLETPDKPLFGSKSEAAQDDSKSNQTDNVHKMKAVRDYYAHRRKHFHDAQMEEVHAQAETKLGQDLRRLDEQIVLHLALLELYRRTSPARGQPKTASSTRPQRVVSKKSRKPEIHNVISTARAINVPRPSDGDETPIATQTTFNASPASSSAPTGTFGLRRTCKAAQITMQEAQQVLHDISLYDIMRR